MNQTDSLKAMVEEAIKRKVLEERAKVVAYLRAAHDHPLALVMALADDIEQGKHDRMFPDYESDDDA